MQLTDEQLEHAAMVLCIPIAQTVSEAYYDTLLIPNAVSEIKRWLQIQEAVNRVKNGKYE